MLVQMCLIGSKNITTYCGQGASLPQRSKCDYINNNLAKSWNAWIKEHKDLPVHYLADAIREKTLTLFAKRRKIANALSPRILHAVIH